MYGVLAVLYTLGWEDMRLVGFLECCMVAHATDDVIVEMREDISKSKEQDTIEFSSFLG